MSNTDPIADGPSQSVVFSTLANARRRRVLRHLLDRKRPVSVTRLARWVAASEADADPKGIRAELYHTHVPKLVDCEFVTYDERDDTVALTGRRDALEPYLALADRYESV